VGATAYVGVATGSNVGAVGTVTVDAIEFLPTTAQ
jgi:hypothetical protein